MQHDFSEPFATPKNIRQHPETQVSCTDDNGIMDYFVVSIISKRKCKSTFLKK